MKRLLSALFLLVWWQAGTAQQITYMSVRQETDIPWYGWTSGYRGLIKVAIPRAAFAIDTSGQGTDVPRISFGTVGNGRAGAGSTVYGSHAALPYDFNQFSTGLGVATYHPDTMTIAYVGLFPFRGVFDLHVRHRGREYVLDSAFNFNGFKEATMDYAYNRNADRITLHNLEGRPGQTLDVEISGVNTTFAQPSPTFAQAGHAPNQVIVNFRNDTTFNTINGTTVLSPTRMVSSITVPPQTPPGYYDVVLVTPQDGFKHINNGFRVLAGMASNPGHIRGTAFLDANRNCRYDQGETPLSGMAVTANPGGYTAITDSIGRYDISVPYGTYEVSRRQRFGWAPVCPQGSYPSVYITLQRPVIDSMDFSDFQTPVQDLGVHAASGNARPGFILDYLAWVSNHGNSPMAKTLMFVPDTVLGFISANPAPSQVRGDTLIWNTGVAPYQRAAFSVRTQVPASINLLGRFLHSQFALTAAPADANPANDTATVTSLVRGSFDPNDKAVYPAGDISMSDTTLVYLIRFQNTGTDTAFTVIVRDTISRYLDLSSLQTLVTSHPFTYKVQEGRQAEWRFDNIRITDSTTNEEKSHGFIKFSINRERELSYGIRIENRAHIHFDFNPPVATNLVHNTLVSVRRRMGNGQAGALQVVPNPVSGKARVVLTGQKARSHATLTIADAMGRTVHRQAGNADRDLEFDLKLKPGLYFVQVREGSRLLAQGRFMAE